MGSELTTKVRLVRCPKCRKVLPELPEFNVYKCGGCGATLQAKHRVNVARGTESGPCDGVVQENQSDLVRDEKERGSGDKGVRPSLDDCSSFQNHESDRSQSGDFDAEQPQNPNDRSCSNSSNCDNEGSEVSNEVFSPTDFVDDKSEEFAPNGDCELGNARRSFVNNDLNHNQNEETTDNENDGRDYHVNEQFAHCEIEEFACHTENEESSREFAENENDELSREFVNAETSFPNQEFKCDENEELVDDEESADDENEGCDDHLIGQFSHYEIEEFPRHLENEASSPEFAHKENELSREFGCDENKEFTQEKNAESGHSEDRSLKREDLEEVVKQESSMLAESNSEYASKKSDSDSNVRRTNTVKSEAVSRNASNTPDCVAVKESLSLCPVVSPRDELKESEKSVHGAYDRLNSEEFNPSSELSGAFGETSKSPRSSHAYDASISSHEGLEDPLPSCQLNLFGDAYKAPSFLHSEERPTRDKFAERTMINRDSDLQHQDGVFWSEKNHASRNEKWDRNEVLKSATPYDQTARNWRPEKHDHRPSPAFHRVAPRNGYESGSPSNRVPEKFQRHSSFQSEWFDDPEQMMKLLKMVFEMQNQRDKSYPPYDNGNNRTTGRSQKPRYDPRYHDYDAHREDHFRHSNDARYLGRYASGSNYADWRRPKKIPFSGEAISRSHQLDPSCCHCFPQEWSRSAQLPHPRYDATGLCRVHPGHSRCACYNAFPPSPQWSVDSEYHPRGREMQPDDLHRRSQDMTSYFSRERHRAVKRHFRPVAGGAPFVNCYKCHVVLQLPADFLLFKKKCHRLKCSACSEVLKFSLKKGSHIIRYRPKIVDPPPPTEAEDYGGDVDRRGEASTSQAPQTDPVSCSEDNELSHRKSLSIEGDTTPVPTPLGRAFDRILYGSYDPSEDSKELVPKPSPGRYMNRPPRYESSRPSSSKSESKKPSSEIQDEQQRSTSPLHRLMGYSSPSQVILGSRLYGQQTSSSYSMQREK